MNFRNTWPFLFLVLSLSVASADTVDTVWVRKYGFVGYRNWGHAITVDASGSVYVAGEYGANEYLTIKYRPSGDTAWVRRYDGSSNYEDIASAVAVDAQGDVYVSGMKFQQGNDFNYYTLKYDSLGNQLWGVEDSGARAILTDRVSLALDDSGNVYLAGQVSQGAPTYYDLLTIKRRTSGDTAWVRAFNGPRVYSDKAKDVAIDRSGNIYVTGYTKGTDSEVCDFLTIKYFPDGDTAWVRFYNSPKDSLDEACGVVVDSIGNVYVTGRTVGDSGGGLNYCTIKYRPNGDTAWVREFSGSSGWSDDEPCGLMVDRFGNVTVTGYSDLGSGYDWCTVSYDSIGTFKWVKRYDNGFWDFPRAITVDSSGNVYVTGESDQGSVEHFLTVKYDTAGTERWTVFYDAPGGGGGSSEGIVLDDSGHVYVTGVYDWLCTTIKYKQFPSGVVEETAEGKGQRLEHRIKAVPNPFTSFATIPGHASVYFVLYDVSGRKVGVCKGDKIGFDVSPGVYFLRPEGPDSKPLRIVKLR